MRRKRREAGDGNNLAFLDVISSGFGAVVLLLVIVKTAEPTIVQDRGIGLESIATELADRLPDLDMQLESLERELADTRDSLARQRERIAQVAPEAQAARAAAADAALQQRASATVVGQMQRARQSLTEEMRRLQQQSGIRASDAVAGIPVDSEYIVFVIDTSGSMHGLAWQGVIRTMREVLDSYPRVRGIQVMSDMGSYMFPNYAGEWMPDSSGRRRIILSRMNTWQPFSNSSPVEGITRAIRTFADPNRKMSIYVLGDDFSGNSVQAVLDTVARINPRDAAGNPQVRIHGIGYPVLFTQGAPRAGGIRFANLMRRLSEANGGTFVGLPDLQ